MARLMIGIVDYGAGNLRSVQKALDYLGADSAIISSPDELEDTTKVVLPGVGAFGAAVKGLSASGLFDPVRRWLLDDRPFLGICLGMQLLLETSSESDGAAGFGVIKGNCVRFEEGKVPQMGWNQLDIAGESRLLDGLESGDFFYFLHGYYVVPEDESVVSARTEYGLSYPSVIERGNVCGVQFHPEKSGDRGLRLLRNWVVSC